MEQVGSQDGSRWLKMAPKMAPRGPKMLPRWAQEAPRCSKMLQDGPKMLPRWPQDAPRCSQDGPKTPQEAAKMGLLAPRCAKMDPRCSRPPATPLAKPERSSVCKYPLAKPERSSVCKCYFTHFPFHASMNRCQKAKSSAETPLFLPGHLFSPAVVGKSLHFSLFQRCVR